MANLDIRVVPNAKRFQIKEESGWLKIHITSEPEKGKANKEIENKLSGILGRKVRVIKGFTSRRKVIFIEGQKEEILETLRKIRDG
ncbi:DUF167 domain-containing protein [Candidatus Micrarchaeota archaeon]|nr:DUF167 domain-containing protein [Candidatus Micrarchaeota archaeon]